MKSRQAQWAAILLMSAIVHTAAATLYVSLASTNPVPPYSDWSIAASNIQDAVDAANPGDTVLVTNGVYASGGRMWFGSGTNRVTLTNAVTLQSVNGPAATLIVGSHVVGTGSVLVNAVRCVGMGNNAVLSGFTLTNGEAGTGNYPTGGGVANLVSISAAGTVTNCVLINNLATNSSGGGASQVQLINCQLIGNYAQSGGGAYNCTLLNCMVVSNTAYEGGGVQDSSLSNCTLADNSAFTAAGGAYGGSLNACTISNNTAANGGGSYRSFLGNCLIVGNRAATGGGLSGGAITNSTVAFNSATNSGGGIYGGAGAYCYNSILYYNTAPTGSNNIGVKIFNCCSIPDSLDTAGITNNPAFVNAAAGDFHLQSNSPCINAGNNTYVRGSTDLDGNPRIVAGTVDIGAYEYQTPVSRISYAWLEQYGLPINTKTDTSDPDGDGLNNYQEWIAGTNPTNAFSVLVMLLPVPTNTPSGLILDWESVSNRTYFLQSSTNLGAQPAFSTIQSNIVGQAGSTAYTDTNAVGSGPYFYRVGVQP